MRKLVVLTIAALAMAGAAVPSAQAADITVHLDVDLLGAAELADCDLTVTAGADGIDLLDEAVDAECIDSYTPSSHPDFGTGVDCINDICGVPSYCVAGECVEEGQPPLWGIATFWAVFENGEWSLGVEEMSLVNGDVVRFKYTNFLAE